MSHIIPKRQKNPPIKALFLEYGICRYVFRTLLRHLHVDEIQGNEIRVDSKEHHDIQQVVGDQYPALLRRESLPRGNDHS